MGRPRKKVDIEIVDPAEESPPLKPVRTVEAKHTIEYREPMTVPTQESDEDESVIWDDEEGERPKKKLHKSVREKIQDRLGKARVTGGDQVFLRIDRMPNYDSGSVDGMGGDREFCWRGPCTVEYITNDDYLADTAKRHGAGVYWFTLRHGKIIVASWMHKIGGNPQVATQVTDSMTGQPQVVYQTLPQANGQSIPAPVPVTKSLKELADIIEVVDRIRGPMPQPQIIQQPEPQLSPKATLLSAMAENPEIVEAVTDKLMGSARDGHKPSITELLIKHGAELAKGIGGMLTDVIRTAASEVKQIKQLDAHLIAQTQGNQNAQNQMPQETNGTTNQTINQPLQTIPSVSPSPTDNQPIPDQTQLISDPKDILIKIALDGCESNTPVKVVAQQLYSFAERVEEEAPHMSVYGWIDIFAENEPEQTIEFMKSGIIGERAREIANTAHCAQWVCGLKKALSEQQEGDES